VHAQVWVKPFRPLILVNDRYPSTNGLQPGDNITWSGLPLADRLSAESLPDEKGETRQLPR
jgi:hypothetical protein